MIDNRRERLIARVVRHLEEAIAKGEFSPSGAIENEAHVRASPFWEAVADTGLSRPAFDAMQAELAAKAIDDPIWWRAAVIAGSWIIKQGLAVHSDLGRIVADEANGVRPHGKAGRPPAWTLAERNRRIFEAVEMTISGDLATGDPCTQVEAFDIVAEAMQRLRQIPASADEIARCYWQERKNDQKAKRDFQARTGAWLIGDKSDPI